MMIAWYILLGVLGYAAIGKIVLFNLFMRIDEYVCKDEEIALIFFLFWPFVLLIFGLSQLVKAINYMIGQGG